MKAIFALVFITLCASVYAYIAPNGVNLNKVLADLEDLSQVIPQKEIILIIEKHRLYDREFQKSIKFMESDQMKDILNDILKSQEIKNIRSYLEKQGWLYSFFELFNFIDNDDSTESDEIDEPEVFAGKRSVNTISNIFLWKKR